MALKRTSLRLCSLLRSQRICRPMSSQTYSSDENSGKKTHFGFETVNEEEKTKKVHEVFETVADKYDVMNDVMSFGIHRLWKDIFIQRLAPTPGTKLLDMAGGTVHEVFETVADKYDVMNDVMSFGIHRLWKDIFIQRLAPTPGTKLLDMAGGTGDITFRYINYLRNLGTKNNRRSSVTVCDINQAMLDVGKTRADRQGYSTDPSVEVSWLCADAEKLPVPDESYDAYTIAFGIRNCTHVDKVLEEAYRALAPGGRFLCLEFSHLPNSTLQWAYDQYSFQVIPVMGELVAGQWKPYKYLVESIRQFPDQENFKAMIENAGFRHVTYENLTFGVCAIHSGFKI